MALLIEQVRLLGESLDVEKIKYNQNARETRENAQVTLSNSKSTRYEMYTVAELINSQGIKEYQYIVQADEVIELSDGYYQHTISLIEPVAFLDTITPASRSFTTRTGDALTLRKILDVYIAELRFYNGLSMVFEEGAWLDKLMTMKQYDGQSMSNIMANLFNGVGANPKAYFDNIGKMIVYPQFNSTRNNLIDEESDTYYISQNSINYATKAKVQAKNAIYEDQTVDWYPSENGYIRPRSSTYVVGENNAEYKLDSNIVQINKVYARAEIVRGVAKEHVGYVDVDITDHVLTDEEFDALLDPGELNKFGSINKTNCVKYDIDSNRIYQLETTDKNWFGWDRQIRHLIYAINYEWQEGNYYELPDDPLPDDMEGVGFNPSPVAEQVIKVQYIRKRDVDYIVNRLNSTNKTQSQMLYSQSSSQVALTKQKQNVGMLANRMGNDVAYRTKFFADDEYLWRVFDYTAKGKKIVEANYTQYATGTFGEFELSENFANVDADTSIARDPSPYTITGKKMQTNVIEENYMLFSESKVDNNTILTEKGVSVANSFLDEVPETKAKHGVYTNPQGERLHMSIMQGGGGFTSTFHVAWRKPIIAGWRIEEINNAQMTQPILYTGVAPLFKLDTFNLYLTSGGTVNDTGEYPKIDDVNFQPYALTKNITRPIYLGLNDSFAYTFALHAIKDSENIIIGQRLMDIMPLHNDEERRFTLYYSDQKFNQTDTDIRITDYTVFGGTITVDKTTQQIDVSGSSSFDNWAIVDTTSSPDATEIVLAANGTKTVYWGFKNNDIAGQIEDIDITYYNVRVDVGVGVNVSYTAFKLRKIEVAPQVGIGVGVNAQYITRKLNVIGIPVQVGIGVGVNASYNVTKLKRLSYDIPIGIGVGVNVAYNVTKFTPQSYAVSVGIGVGVNVAYNINRTQTVTFEDYDGDVLKTTTVDYGDNAVPPSDPTRTDYTFFDWDGDYTNVTSNRTITATYVQLLWVSGGTSSEASSTPDDCVNSGDVGNVRVASAACEWVTYDGYQSQQDESTTVTCSEGATRVLCNYFTNFNQWSCSMQEGHEDEEYETCEVV